MDWLDPRTMVEQLLDEIREHLGWHAAWLIERVRNGDDFTVRGLVAELAERGLSVSRFAVWRFVKAAGLSWKKNGGRRRAK